MEHHLTFWPGMAVMLLVLLLNGAVFFRFFRSRFGKPRTVSAEVIGTSVFTMDKKSPPVILCTGGECVNPLKVDG